MTISVIVTAGSAACRSSEQPCLRTEERLNKTATWAPPPSGILSLCSLSKMILKPANYSGRCFATMGIPSSLSVMGSPR